MEVHRIYKSVVEIVNSSDYASFAVNGAKIISGSEAFRRYDWLRQVPVTNVSGNLRGMVVSSDWNSAFQLSDKTGRLLDAAGGVIAFASFVINIQQSYSQIRSVLRSNVSGDLKAAQISAYVSSAAIRALTGIVPSAAHVLALSLEGNLTLIDLATGGKSRGFKKASNFLRDQDAFVSTKYDQVTDGGNIYHFLQAEVNPRIGALFGF